ncbi:predicted protein [Aspergillus terreus NIH2624]|uniref:Uncharacterized protein n=1 Tax=Aspergillus terreus (strain NIH 2624 / FGSC A1156) TaxID=341663 RepID=Q0C9C2_ASPTN|nr:uncharacterized protein ATEG_09712 [Aspergillus terreus NIH2624]EAU29903.1 predicted protein [Aspergillus terreus NIH2624]
MSVAYSSSRVLTCHYPKTSPLHRFNANSENHRCQVLHVFHLPGPVSHHLHVLYPMPDANLQVPHPCIFEAGECSRPFLKRLRNHVSFLSPQISIAACLGIAVQEGLPWVSTVYAFIAPMSKESGRILMGCQMGYCFKQRPM